MPYLFAGACFLVGLWIVARGASLADAGALAVLGGLAALLHWLGRRAGPGGHDGPP